MSNPIPQPKIPGQFTREELKQFNGEVHEHWPIYVGVNGKVYDVSSKRDMYQKGTGYHVFAGRDATRALAKSSLKEEDFLPEGVTNDLDDKEKQTLQEWETFYAQRYPLVGTIINN